MKSSTQGRFPLTQRGMTLVEVMVGLAIGMIGMLVIFQTVSVWDARTRATSAGSDSQVTGSIAMYSIERDLRLAGQGFGGAESAIMGCQVSGFDQNASGPLGFPMTPVVIVDNDATNEPDQIATLYGTSAYFTSQTTYSRVTAQTVSAYDRTGFKSGDLAVVANLGTGAPASAECQLVEVTDDSAPADPKTMAFVQGSYPHFYSNGSNLPSRFNTAAGIGASFPSGTAYSLGPLPRRNVWQIASGVLGTVDEIGINGSVFCADRRRRGRHEGGVRLRHRSDGRVERRLDQDLAGADRLDHGARDSRRIAGAQPQLRAAGDQCQRAELLRPQSGVACERRRHAGRLRDAQRRRHDRLVHAAAIRARTTGATTATPSTRRCSRCAT